jgi:hypothetical protein
VNFWVQAFVKYCSLHLNVSVACHSMFFPTGLHTACWSCLLIFLRFQQS